MSKPIPPLPKNPESAGRAARLISAYFAGNAHTHTEISTHNHGAYESSLTFKEEAVWASRAGLEFLAFTEHASNPGSPRLLPPTHPICRSLLVQAGKIEYFNIEHSYRVPMVFSGVEASIIFHDSCCARLDVPDEILSQLDLVIASRHSILREKRIPSIEESLLYAIRHPLTDVIGHPDRNISVDQICNAADTGVQTGKYWAMWSRLLAEMAVHNKAFEINIDSQPGQELVRRAAAIPGLRFALNFDAHDICQFRYEAERGMVRRTKPQRFHERWGYGAATPEDMRMLAAYKVRSLAMGPGVGTLKRLVDQIEFLRDCGISPRRIVNSSFQRFIQFLTLERGKRTHNLYALSEHAKQE